MLGILFFFSFVASVYVAFIGKLTQNTILMLAIQKLTLLNIIYLKMTSNLLERRKKECKVTCPRHSLAMRLNMIEKPISVLLRIPIL